MCVSSSRGVVGGRDREAAKERQRQRQSETQGERVVNQHAARAYRASGLSLKYASSWCPPAPMPSPFRTPFARAAWDTATNPPLLYLWYIWRDDLWHDDCAVHLLTSGRLRVGGAARVV